MFGVINASGFSGYNVAMNTIQIADVKIGPDAPLAIIAGPCVAESLELCLKVGDAMRARCRELGFGYIFKASFDKANRSSIHSYRGPGLEQTMQWFEIVKSELGVPVTTDVHEASQAKTVGGVCDVLQIPAFLCRQTDLLQAAAQTGKAVSVKKGQFLSPEEMSSVVEKLVESGADKAGIMLMERGTFFGYQRLVNDFVGVSDMMKHGWPVCFDVTHSTQLPGGSSSGDGRITGGRPDCAPMLAKCAVVAGVQCLFMEVHPDPRKGKSDSATMLGIEEACELLGQLKKLRDAM
tara:strand:- start:1703 stop:2581 length:879 start_codon:yes stop_codon:yes gene_type:complete